MTPDKDYAYLVAHNLCLARKGLKQALERHESTPRVLFWAAKVQEYYNALVSTAIETTGEEVSKQQTTDIVRRTHED